jgi:hypothetical protein
MILSSGAECCQGSEEQPILRSRCTKRKPFLSANWWIDVMIGKTDKNPQLNVFRTPLVSVINMKHEFIELAQRIDWKSTKKDFGSYYSEMGLPAVPISRMAGCMLPKQIYGLSDESFIDRWMTRSDNRPPLHPGPFAIPTYYVGTYCSALFIAGPSACLKPG